MLGLDRHAARVTWTVFLMVLVILVAYMARHTIIVFLVALFFAYMLSPAGWIPRPDDPAEHIAELVARYRLPYVH